MTHRRRFIIQIVFLALFLVLCMLLFPAAAAQEDETWRNIEFSHHSAFHGPREDGIPRYRGPVVNQLQEYFDDEVLSEVEEEELEALEGGDYDEIYHGGDYNSLPHCPHPNQDDHHRTVVLVSTLDGRITALDLVSGAVLWSHQTGGSSPPLLSSSMSKLEVTSRGEWVRLIPSLDGGIFRFDGEGVEALPVTAETLLHSSFKFNPETIFTGGKVTEVWGVALGSGRVTYVCNGAGCKRQRMASPSPTSLLVVRRVTQTVRAVDPKSGDERWNFSVGQHEVNIAGGGCEYMGSRGRADDFEYVLPTLHFVVPDGVIMGMDNKNALIWQQKLSSPVVSAWRVLDGELEEVDLFSTVNVPALSPDKGLQHTQEGGAGGVVEEEEKQQPALYVGVHQKQLYIQQSGGMRHKVTSATRIFLADSEGEGSTMARYPRVQWRPYLATAPSRTPIVNYNSRHHPLLLSYELNTEPSTAIAITHHIDYPFDNGYYLYADESLGQINLTRPLERPQQDLDEEEAKEENLMDEVAAQIMHICFHIGPDTWVKLGVALGCYAALHYILLRYMVTYMQRRITRQALTLVTHIVHHILNNNPQIVALIQRMGLQLRALPPPPPPPPPGPPTPAADDNEGNALPPPATSAPPAQEHPGPVERAESSSTEYTSRYLTDFEVVQCLGRGGFGVVCQVRNKLDENEYAVKRIVMPTKKSSAERVKREVRALAKLNHTNIVRYYNSWLESPPPGWQDETNTLLGQGDVLSTSLFSPGTEESHNWAPGASGAGAKEESESLARVVKHLGAVGEVPSESGIHGDLTSGDEEDTSSCSSSDSTEGGKRNSASAGEGEESFDIVFESSQQDRGSQTAAGDRKDTSASSLGGKDSWEDLASSSSSSGQSQSIVFEEQAGQRASSHLQTNSDHDLDGSPGQPRRRVRSQPTQNHLLPGGERPRTLSLGSTAAPEGRNKSKPKEDEGEGGVGAARASQVPRSFLYIQMELCQKESLRDWLVQNTVREQRVVLAMFNDVTRAVEYVHDNHLMHRDLKPSNIFFSLEGEVKVGDFGLVTTIAEEEEQHHRHTAALTPASALPTFLAPGRTHTHRVGTQLYMSPEQVSGQVYDYKVDIYSLGLIFFEMLVPFGTGMERLAVMTRLREGHFPDGFEERFPDESSLLKLMLSKDPACRPTTRGIRARNPLRPLQGQAVDDISPEDHFRLSRQRSHFSSSASLSTSSNTSTTT